MLEVSKRFSFLVDFWVSKVLFAFETIRVSSWRPSALLLMSCIFYYFFLLVCLFSLTFFFSWKRSDPILLALMTFCGLTCQMFEAPYQVFFWKEMGLEPLDDSVSFHYERSPTCTHGGTLQNSTFCLLICRAMCVLYISL